MADNQFEGLKGFDQLGAGPAPKVNVNNGNNAGNADNGVSGIMSGGKQLGFSLGNSGVMKATKGSEYTTKIANGLIELYKQNPVGRRPKVKVLDKSIFEFLSYSIIVVSMEVKNTVAYYLIVLEGTGNRPMTAKAFNAEIVDATRNNKKAMIYTIDDAINPVSKGVVSTILKEEYGEKDMVSVEGLVVPTDHEEIEMIVPMIGSIAFNACYVELGLTTGEIVELNIKKAIEAEKNATLRIDLLSGRTTSKNEVGRPVRTDFQIITGIKDKSTQGFILNTSAANVVLTKTSGFIDLIQEEVQQPVMPGYPVIKNTRLRPQIVINSIATGIAPTVGYTILGLISSLVIANRAAVTNMLIPTDVNNKHHVGALNIITNLENNENGVGGMIDLHSKRLTKEKLLDYINRMVPLDPIISMDIDSFGPQTYMQSIIAVAARPGNDKETVAARQEFIDILHWVTAGNFPKDYNHAELFNQSGVVVPTGKWLHTTEGEKDIREVDLAFLAAETKDIRILNEWSISTLPREVTGIDPFLTRAKIISQVIPEAEISGKAIRVSFHGKLLQTMEQAAIAAGLNVELDQSAIFGTQTSSIDIIGNYLQAGAVSGVGSFARASSQNTANFFTQYANIGGRFF